MIASKLKIGMLTAIAGGLIFSFVWPPTTVSAGVEYFGGKITSIVKLPIGPDYIRVKGDRKSWKVLRTGALIGVCVPGAWILGWGAGRGRYVVPVMAFCGK
jgi:hypothetical protein